MDAQSTSSSLSQVQNALQHSQLSLLWEIVFGLPVSFDYEQEEWPISEEECEEMFNAGGPSYHIHFTLPKIEFIFHSDYEESPPGHLIRYEVLKNLTGLPYSGGYADDDHELERLIQALLTEFMEEYSAGEIGDCKRQGKKKSSALKAEQPSLFECLSDK